MTPKESEIKVSLMGIRAQCKIMGHTGRKWRAQEGNKTEKCQS